MAHVKQQIILIHLIEIIDKYIINKSFNSSTNTLLININKSSSLSEQFMNKERFDTTNLIVKIKYNDNIEIEDIDTFNRFLEVSFDSLITSKPTIQNIIKPSTWNKYKNIIIGSSIGLLVLLIIIFVYFKFIRKH